MDADAPKALVPDFGLRSGMQPKVSNLKNGRPPWPEWVENLYFLIWMKAGCTPRAAAREAETLWPLFTDEPFQQVPYQTIMQWQHRHNWHQKATQTVAGIYPQIVMDTLAKVALAGNRFAETLLAAAHGEFASMDASKERNLIEWTKLALLASGAGTFGTRDRVAQPVKSLAVDSEVDFSTMTAQELARWEAELIAKSRSTDQDERRRR